MNEGKDDTSVGGIQSLMDVEEERRILEGMGKIMEELGMVKYIIDLVDKNIEIYLDSVWMKFNTLYTRFQEQP